MAENGSSKENASSSAAEVSKPATPSLREQGNAFFKAGNYLRAAATYTHAIKEDPTNPALYSNRSAAFLHLSKVTKALADAEMTLKLKPDWDKGYFRKACALESMQRYDEALAAFKEAADRNPGSSEVSAKMKLLIRTVRDQKRASVGNNAAQNGHQEGSTRQQSTSEPEKRVEAFQNDVLAAAERAWEESGGTLEATVSFLEDGRGEDGKEKISRVVVREAFDSPDTFSGCLDFLRKHAKEGKKLAGALVVCRRSIAFPQVWKGRGAASWQHGDSDGFFVQMESPSVRRVWFVPSIEGEAGGRRAGPPQELSIETFALLQPVFR